MQTAATISPEMNKIVHNLPDKAGHGRQSMRFLTFWMRRDCISQDLVDQSGHLLP
jgi:hypothetical protein